MALLFLIPPLEYFSPSLEKRQFCKQVRISANAAFPAFLAKGFQWQLRQQQRRQHGYGGHRHSGHGHGGQWNMDMDHLADIWSSYRRSSKRHKGQNIKKLHLHNTWRRQSFITGKGDVQSSRHWLLESEMVVWRKSEFLFKAVPHLSQNVRVI